jgi:hypothetical protein
MKLKCIDGKVREFIIAEVNEFYWHDNGAKCKECGKDFGVHDTKYLKEQFKNHICKPKQ